MGVKFQNKTTFGNNFLLTNDTTVKLHTLSTGIDISKL